VRSDKFCVGSIATRPCKLRKDGAPAVLVMGIGIKSWATRHVEEYAEESWMQSEPLLLADAAGTVAVGYCQQPFDGTPEFDTVCTQRIGEIRSWALLGKPLVPKEPR
jgi:hypothetical protein